MHVKLIIHNHILRHNTLTILTETFRSHRHSTRWRQYIIHWRLPYMFTWAISWETGNTWSGCDENNTLDWIYMCFLEKFNSIAHCDVSLMWIIKYFGIQVTQIGHLSGLLISEQGLDNFNWEAGNHSDV